MPPRENLNAAAATLQNYLQANKDCDHVSVTARGQQLQIRVDEEVIAVPKRRERRTISRLPQSYWALGTHACSMHIGGGRSGRH